MDDPDLSAAERLRHEAEERRHRQELVRQTQERARVAAEDARTDAEERRTEAAGEVRDTVAILTTLLQRMEAVEKLRRTPPQS